VFPTEDGRFIQFVAQNKRRCDTGNSEEEDQLLYERQRQVSLFQQVTIKREQLTAASSSTRYRLVESYKADPDGKATRFICKFSNGEETLSVFNFSYEWAARRRRMKRMFHEHGRENNQVFSSQLLFMCPVPASLIEAVKTGLSIIDDYATIFVDLIPIRTTPRYGPPEQVLSPYNKDFELQSDSEWVFNATVE
jgi:hypothetical protein